MNERVEGMAGGAPTDASGFAGAQPRLAKTAQYIAIFRLAAVAPYLLAPVKCKATVGSPTILAPQHQPHLLAV